MSRICYRAKKFTPAHQRIVEQANDICEEYAQQGLVLTLRQIFYQFVSRDLMANRQTEYDRLGAILEDARMAGEMDWDLMIDRTRRLVSMPHWDGAANFIEHAADEPHTFHIDLWRGQHRRVMVFVEKDAAIGVIDKVCDDNDVPYFSCRGYSSTSAIWTLAQQIRRHIECGDQVTILHIGDHDPSGIDMTRDLKERLKTFLVRDWLLTWGADLLRPVTVGDVRQSMREKMRGEGGDIADGEPPWRLKRIALNIDQIQRYGPPPNPVKTSDGRHRRYTRETGLTESWELDALNPSVLQQLIQDEVDAVRDEDRWADNIHRMEKDQVALRLLSQQWTDVERFLREGRGA